jgi:MFS family permease
VALEFETQIAEAEVARAGTPPRGDVASLWRNRDFRIVVGGQGLSALGDAVSYTALPLLVLALTGSGVLMGVVGILQTLPDLVFGLVAGAYADRHDRRRMIIYGDLGRAVLTALIPISFWLGLPTMAVILLVTTPIHVLRVFWLAAWTAAVPSLVGRDMVGRASGIAEAFFSLAFIVGPALAGILAGTIGPAPTLAIDAASFLLSVGAFVFVRRPLQAAAPSRDVRLVSDVLEGVRYVWGQPTLRAIIAFWTAISVASAPITAAVVYYLRLDRGASPELVGVVLSAFSVGYLVGSLLAGYATKGRVGLVILGGSLVGAAGLLGFALGGPLPVLLAMAGLIGLAEALVLVSYLTLRTTIPPDRLLGRVGSTARMFSVGLAPIGFFAGGVLLDIVHGQTTLLLVGAATAVVAVAGLLSAPLRAARVPQR